VRNAGLGTIVALMLPYVLTLAVLAVSAGRVRPPAGLGRDFVARR